MFCEEKPPSDANKKKSVSKPSIRATIEYFSLLVVKKMQTGLFSSAKNSSGASNKTSVHNDEKAAYYLLKWQKLAIKVDLRRQTLFKATNKRKQKPTSN